MTKQVKIRRPYDASVRHSITFPENTMAKQAFKDECDINTIMAKYQKTGLIEHVQKVQGSYGDFTSVQDYQLSLNQVIAAQDAFDALPSSIRARFANDPSNLMAFISDDANYDEALKMGLIPPKPDAPAPQRVEIVNPPQPKGSSEPSGDARKGDDPATSGNAAPPKKGP